MIKEIQSCKEVPYTSLSLGEEEEYYFQLAHWSENNWQKVVVLFVGKEYIITQKVSTGSEHCWSQRSEWDKRAKFVAVDKEK